MRFAQRILNVCWIMWVMIAIFYIFSSFNVSLGGKVIVWSKDRKLLFDDFTLVRGPLKGDIAASTCTGIYLTYNYKDSSYHAEAIFDTERSIWSTTHLINKAHILQHEQGHFDLTEYIVRRLNKDMRGKNRDIQLTLFEVYKEELDILQKMYDKETNHSRDTTYQDLWNKTINNLLTYN